MCNGDLSYNKYFHACTDTKSYINSCLTNPYQQVTGFKANTTAATNGIILPALMDNNFAISRSFFIKFWIYNSSAVVNLKDIFVFDNTSATKGMKAVINYNSTTPSFPNFMIMNSSGSTISGNISILKWTNIIINAKIDSTSLYINGLLSGTNITDQFIISITSATPFKFANQPDTTYTNYMFFLRDFIISPNTMDLNNISLYFASNTYYRDRQFAFYYDFSTLTKDTTNAYVNNLVNANSNSILGTGFTLVDSLTITSDFYNLNTFPTICQQNEYIVRINQNNYCISKLIAIINNLT